MIKGTCPHCSGQDDFEYYSKVKKFECQICGKMFQVFRCRGCGTGWKSPFSHLYLKEITTWINEVKTKLKVCKHCGSDRIIIVEYSIPTEITEYKNESKELKRIINSINAKPSKPEKPKNNWKPNDYEKFKHPNYKRSNG